MKNCEMCMTDTESLNHKFKYWKLLMPPKPLFLKGYIIITPLEHKEFWNDISEEEFVEFGVLISRIESALKKFIPLERLYSITISEQVRHLHVHLIPRLKGSEHKGIDLIQAATKSYSNESNNKELFELFIQEITN